MSEKGWGREFGERGLERVPGTVPPPPSDSATIDRLLSSTGRVAFPPCPECDGSGVLGGCNSPECDHQHTFMFCPSCGGRGVLITDELVEAGGQAAYQAWMDYRIHHDVGSNDAGLWDAVAVAVVEKLKENQ